MDRFGILERISRVDALRQPRNVNHTLHMLVTIATFGLWLPVWLGLTLAQEGWKHRHCWIMSGKSIKGMSRINRLDIPPETRHLLNRS
jgi:hypothetical protein